MTASRPPAEGCEFASFWHGTLNPFAYACLASFAQAGASLRVYSYDPRLDLPAGRAPRGRQRDLPGRIAYPALYRQRQAVDRDVRGHVPLPYDPGDRLLLGRYRHPLLGEARFRGDGSIFCRQADAVGTGLVNNAVLRLPPSHPALAELVAAAEAAIDVDQRWGALGPFLLTPVLTKYGLTERALDSHVCYPIEPEQFWKLFLPGLSGLGCRGGARRDLRASLERSDRVERLRLLGCPPAGSYLQRSVPARRRARPVPPRRERG